MSWPATVGSAASALTGVKDAAEFGVEFLERASSRATPTTFAPAWLSAVAMARPNPRLAPVTSTVAPANSVLA